jgi:UDP-2,3-diacylglucosamine hydrolase
MAYCFISDLHLHESRPDITEAFIKFTTKTANQAERLYILGDFFETWIGDDDKNDLVSLVKETLIELNQSTKIYAMHGNRDFLIGNKFLQETGAVLLEDPKKENMFGRSVLLMHGDLLCTDDKDYQSFRKTTREASWQRDFLSKPLLERKEIASELRATSKKATSEKKESIMDVSDDEVKKVMTNHSVNLLIHGHTHRPNKHSLTINNIPSQRIVLGDWDNFGWYIWMDSNSCELKKFSIL